MYTNANQIPTYLFTYTLAYLLIYLNTFTYWYMGFRKCDSGWSIDTEWRVADT